MGRGPRLLRPFFNTTMIHPGSIVYALVLVTVTVTGATESGIVGGRVAMPHSRPYMASLHYQGQHPCGGILIRKDFVLTAAHCKYQDNMVVVLGAHNISDKEKMQQRIEVAKYYKYPDYTGGFDYDIMLLKLKTKATLNKYVKTIDLPKKDRSFPANVKCAVAGWGKTGSTVTNSKVLRETTEKTQSSPECKKVRGEYFSEDDLHQVYQEKGRNMPGIKKKHCKKCIMIRKHKYFK
ncbi:granzyme B-like [Nothobranchius furzeri]|uniref:granzyme B-like n=1 Tax=Nothobranchius furzeri TaxID=105023 RepID=UPI003904A8AE